jgi:tetratricopeptide (TPR) repeat protein
VTLNNLGFLLQSMKRLDESREAYRKGLELLERLALDYPSVPVYRKELANISNNNAIVRARAGDWSGAESAWESALSRFEKLATEHPDVPDYAGNRGMAVGNLGWLRLQTARDAGLGAAAGSVGGAAARLAELNDATQRLQAARSLVRTALKANPENPTYLSILCDQTQYLAEARAEAGDYVEAARLAEELPTLYSGRAQDYAAGAGVLALCSSRCRADAGAADDYGRRAVRLLEEAFEHGWRDVSRLEEAPLNALAERDDFRKMREKWTAAGR